MGCGCSRVTPESPWYSREDEIDFALLKLTYKDLKALASVFAKVDPAGERRVDIKEFLGFFHIDTNLLTYKIFGMTEDHHDNKLSFRQVRSFCFQMSANSSVVL